MAFCSQPGDERRVRVESRPSLNRSSLLPFGRGRCSDARAPEHEEKPIRNEQSFEAAILLAVMRVLNSLYYRKLDWGEYVLTNAVVYCGITTVVMGASAETCLRRWRPPHHFSTHASAAVLALSAVDPPWFLPERHLRLKSGLSNKKFRLALEPDYYQLLTV